MAELVQRGPEIVEDDTVGEALEDKGKLPERVDDTDGDRRGHGQDVDDDADHAEAHAEKQDAEPGRDSDDLDEAELVAEFDVPEEIDDGEYPPRITGGRNGQQRLGLGRVELLCREAAPLTGKQPHMAVFE